MTHVTPHDDSGLPLADYHRIYYRQNRERLLAKQRAWTAKNKDKKREYARRYREKNGPRRAAYAKKYNTENPFRNVNAHLLRKYGITIEQYQALLQKQDGVCAICRRREGRKNKTGTPQRLSVDHCHKTGRVRGLLCSTCNHTLGRLGEDVESFRRAVAYLGG